MADTPKEELQKLVPEFRKLFEAEKEIAEAGLTTTDLDGCAGGAAAGR